MGYREIYDAAKADPEAFWLKAAEGIDWVEKPKRALDASNAPLYEWFTDAKVNTCWNAVDRHVEAGRGDQVAIIYDSPITGASAKITYSELQEKVARLARGLGREGRDQGRPGHHLYVDGARGRDRDAGRDPDWRNPLGRVRRLCCQ